MRTILNTVRMRLEPVTDQHLPLLVELNSDPEVMRFLLGRAATQEETYAEWSRRRGPQTDDERGLGYWAGFDERGFVGWWSASSFAHDEAQTGLGYRLARAAWGRGLAAEGGAAMIDQAFRVPNVGCIVASTMAVNTASRRVLEKLCLQHVATSYDEWPDPLPGSELGEVIYRLDKADHAGG